MPRAEQREAHLAVRVQVGIEADHAIASRLQVDERRHCRVVRRDEDVELEETKAVRGLARAVARVGRAGEEHLERVHARLVLARKDGRLRAHRQRAGIVRKGELLELAHQPLHLCARFDEGESNGMRGGRVMGQPTAGSWKGAMQGEGKMMRVRGCRARRCWRSQGCRRAVGLTLARAMASGGQSAMLDL